MRRGQVPCPLELLSTGRRSLVVQQMRTIGATYLYILRISIRVSRPASTSASCPLWMHRTTTSMRSGHFSGKSWLVIVAIQVLSWTLTLDCWAATRTGRMFCLRACLSVSDIGTTYDEVAEEDGSLVTSVPLHDRLIRFLRYTAAARRTPGLLSGDEMICSTVAGIPCTRSSWQVGEPPSKGPHVSFLPFVVVKVQRLCASPRSSCALCRTFLSSSSLAIRMFACGLKLASKQATRVAASMTTRLSAWHVGP